MYVAGGDDESDADTGGDNVSSTPPPYTKKVVSVEAQYDSDGSFLGAKRITRIYDAWENRPEVEKQTTETNASEGEFLDFKPEEATTYEGGATWTETQKEATEQTHEGKMGSGCNCLTVAFHSLMPMHLTQHSHSIRRGLLPRHGARKPSRRHFS